MQTDTLPKAKCLQRITEIFPNIDTEYISELYINSFDETITGECRCSLIIGQLSESPSYPVRRDKPLQLKRKRSAGEADLDDPPKKFRPRIRKTRADRGLEITEEENERLARENGALLSCDCCFGEVPANRVVFCCGEPSHPCCWDCMRQYVNSQVGSASCQLKCVNTDGCAAIFDWQKELYGVLEESIFRKLVRLQQEEELKSAGLAGLEECPFCDFKALYEQPPEIDREFRCSNPDCEKVSCRLCHTETHIPLSCEEHAKENKINARHTVEEAMTEALVRKCNKCNNRFIKEEGCNKMKCPKCKNSQCYCCGANVQGNYTHFHESGGKCPLYDNHFKRHEDDVRQAEVAALAKVKADNPGISDEDLMVKVSENVRRFEEQQKKRAEEHIRPDGRGPAIVNFGVQPDDLAVDALLFHRHRHNARPPVRRHIHAANRPRIDGNGGPHGPIPVPPPLHAQVPVPVQLPMLPNYQPQTFLGPPPGAGPLFAPAMQSGFPPPAAASGPFPQGFVPSIPTFGSAAPNRDFPQRTFAPPPPVVYPGDPPPATYNPQYPQYPHFTYQPPGTNNFTATPQVSQNDRVPENANLGTNNYANGIGVFGFQQIAPAMPNGGGNGVLGTQGMQKTQGGVFGAPGHDYRGDASGLVNPHRNRNGNWGNGG